MTDTELQSDNENLNNSDNQQSQTAGKSGAELAPATGENQPKNENGGINQEKANAAINRQHYLRREEERKRIAAEEENQKLKERLASLESSQEQVVIPPIPDSFDPDFDKKIQEREAAIAKQAAINARKEFEQQQSGGEQQASTQSDAERQVAEAAEKYNQRVLALGLKPEEMVQAGKTISEYNVAPDVIMHILGLEDGPLVTKYLVDNPLELDELRYMSPINAAFRINSAILPVVQNLKPKPSETPDPAPEVNGGRAVGSGESPLIKGATFE